MGWSTGAAVLDEVWGEVVDRVPKKEQKDLALRLVKIFQDEDADTIESESEYPVLRQAARELSDDYDPDEDPDED